jgi:type VI protein secretion system component VasK
MLPPNQVWAWRAAMKVFWWIIQGTFSLGSLVITYIPIFRALIAKDTEQILSVDWAWWLFIGFTIFVVTIISVIVRLGLELRYFHSEDYERKKRKDELEIHELEHKYLEKEHPTII